jgi:hypothetical protein
VTRIDGGRARRPTLRTQLPGAILIPVALVMILGLAAAPAHAAAPAPVTRTGAAATPQASSGPPATSGVRTILATAASRAALVQAYESARHLPPRSVAGIRPGSLHLASAPASKVSWAIADFRPSSALAAAVAAGFQDGASTGVFTQAAGQPWRLARTGGGPGGCDRALPAAVRAAWHLVAPAGCQASASSQRRAAAGARSEAGPADTVGQSIADIALSQVGVSDTPVVTSFNGVDCDPYSTLVGAASPNADGCGFDQKFSVENENEAWCSDFAKWVWQQAGVTADMNTINAGSDSFYDWGLDQGEAMPVDSGTPAVGDAVVFFPPGPITPTAYADHVGIVTAVNPDGTVNLANGDFLGASNISVQYDTDISLTTWASQVWSPGEQWLLVTPPTAAQASVPAAAIAGPHVAVAGTAVAFRARAAQRGGSVTQDLWNFGDGRNTNATGADASHVFAGAGLYPVTMSATSSLGTVTTRTWNVDVVAASSTVASTPSTAVWYSTTPVNQFLFLATGTGGLAAESWDGASWLRQAIPGQTGAGSGLTALNYPDATTGSTEPHVYFGTAGGGLAETYQSGGTWATHPLAGLPAAGSAIVATTTAASGTADPSAGGPAVFYVNAAGQLTESYQQGTAWAASILPLPPTASPGSLALADTGGGGQSGQAGERLYYLDRRGSLVVASSPGHGRYGQGWQAAAIRSGLGVAAGSPLAAVTTGPGGDEQLVFFIDGRGRLAEATSGRPGAGPAVRELPGTPGPATSLAATNYLLPSGAPGENAGDNAMGAEVFYRTAAGQPAVTSWNGQQWQAATLPGLPATAILAADGYPAAGQPEQLFLADVVYWTGVGVIPTTITAAQAQQTAAEFGHQILVWDNYPVNDYQPTRLFLGPLVGRSADLGQQVAGFTSNPMQEAAPSTIPLFTTADYTWNPAAYDSAPQAAWDAGLDAYGGPAARTLTVFAENNQSTPRIGTTPESPTLTALIAAFWTAYHADAGPAISPGLRAAAARLQAAWVQIAAAPPAIERLLPHPDFLAAAAPWLAKFRDYGLAGAAAVRLLLDTKAGATGAAASAAATVDALYRQASAIPQVVGEGVFEAFLLTADPALFAADVRLYAATPADYQAALQAASAAGLPGDQVTQSFATAWAQASSGEYLVIAVGGSADSALYFNACGWSNPSGLPGGSTPFYLATPPLDTLPAMNAYENGAGETASQTGQLSGDLAYYAAHGQLPAGVTSLPAAASPAAACSGEPG